jgi:hypothetical protein
MRIRYRTSRGCDYDTKLVEEDLDDFVYRSGDIGLLVELLVSAGVLSPEDVFDSLKSQRDYGDFEVVDK